MRRALSLAFSLLLSVPAGSDTFEPPYSRERLSDHNAYVNIAFDVGESLINEKKYKEALEQFLYALEVEPGNPAVLDGVAFCSFKLGRYGDAAWAYKERERTQPASTRRLIEYGISLMVLGDYAGAYRILNNGSSDGSVQEWRIVAAYGMGGWDTAVATFQNGMPPRWAAAPGRETSDNVGFLLRGGIQDMDRRATESGMRYAGLVHKSLLYGLHEDARDQFIYFDDKGGQASWNAMWDAINAYRSLPLKPAPPSRAVEAAAQGDALIGKVGGYKNSAGYHYNRAIRLAPWWPEARYNMALLGEYSKLSSSEMRYIESSANNATVAAQELIIYLKLAPKGEHAKEARSKLKKWKQTVPVD